MATKIKKSKHLFSKHELNFGAKKFEELRKYFSNMFLYEIIKMESENRMLKDYFNVVNSSVAGKGSISIHDIIKKYSKEIDSAYDIFLPKTIKLADIRVKRNMPKNINKTKKKNEKLKK